MALFCSRLAGKALKSQITIPCRFYAPAKDLPDPMELATGREKFEKLQKLSGNKDPFRAEPVPRLETSSKENPNIVPSVYDCRLVACSCNPDNASLVWMWVFKGEPRRCACGHWFKLADYKV